MRGNDFAGKEFYKPQRACVLEGRSDSEIPSLEIKFQPKRGKIDYTEARWVQVINCAVKHYKLLPGFEKFKKVLCICLMKS